MLVYVYLLVSFVVVVLCLLCFFEVVFVSYVFSYINIVVCLFVLISFQCV